jgi:hypothetical protein
MALNKVTLSALIVSKIEAQLGAAHLEETELQKFADAIADAVVTHIQASAAVVTACPAGAGTGTVA